MSNLKTVQRVVLYVVRFSQNDKGSGGDEIFIASESEAKRLAQEKRAFYGSQGSYYEKEFNPNDLPKYFETADAWARDNMTYNEYIAFSRGV